MGVWSCQGLYGCVVMSRTVWAVVMSRTVRGVWSFQGLIEMSMVSTWPWTVSSLCSKITHSTIL